MTHRTLTRTTALTLCLALTAPGAGLAQADNLCPEGNDQACENANDRGALAKVMASLAAGQRPTAGQIGQLNKGELKKLIKERDLDIDPRGMPPADLRAAVMAELGIEGSATAEGQGEPQREEDKAEAESGVVDELAQALTGGEEAQQEQAEVGAEALTEEETEAEAEASDHPLKELTRKDIDRLNRKELLQVIRRRGLDIDAQGIGTADLRTAVKAELGMKGRANKAKREGEPQRKEDKVEAESGVVEELAQALTGGDEEQQAQADAEAQAQAEVEAEASDQTREDLTRNDIGGMTRTQLLKVIRQRDLAIDPQGMRTGDLRNAVGRELGLMQTTAQQRPEQTGDNLGDALEKAAEGAVDELEQSLDQDKAEREAELDRRRAEKDADADKPMAADSGAETEGDANVTTQTVTEENARSSDEEFKTQLKAGAEATTRTRAKKDDDGLSALGTAAAVGLGALALNEILSADDEVVTSSRDRVVIRQDGELRVLKNDDVHLMRPGNEVQTRTFDDGSTRTVVLRADGSKIITIRAADGRVLRRVRVRADGSRNVIFDDTQHAHEPVVVRNLPEPPRESGVTYSRRDRAALEEALNAELAADVNRRFSLRQVRDISAVRKLMPPVTLDAVNFRTDSAVIRPREAEDLAALGEQMAAAIDHNPDEVFLVEGHTDTVGSASYNLALSDRRAESVALALVEYFDVPPENLVIQGYGESDLAVAVRGPERANRRATVRRITPLLHRGE